MCITATMLSMSGIGRMTRLVMPKCLAGSRDSQDGPSLMAGREGEEEVSENGAMVKVNKGNSKIWDKGWEER